MAKSAAKETSRLEARIPTAIYDQMQRAARMRGMTLTAYLLATAGEDARRTVEEAAIIRMTRADQIRFADALAKPGKPNERMKRAAKLHAALIAPR